MEWPTPCRTPDDRHLPSHPKAEGKHARPQPVVSLDLERSVLIPLGEPRVHFAVSGGDAVEIALNEIP